MPSLGLQTETFDAGGFAVTIQNELRPLIESDRDNSASVSGTQTLGEELASNAWSNLKAIRL